MQNSTVKNAPNGSIRLQFTIKSTHTHYTQPKPDRRDRCDMKWWDMTRYYHLIMITISWITTNLKLGNSVTKYLIFQQVCCHPDSRALRRRSIFKEGQWLWYKSFATDVVAILDDQRQKNCNKLYCPCHPTWPLGSLSFESLWNGFKPPIMRQSRPLGLPFCQQCAERPMLWKGSVD